MSYTISRLRREIGKAIVMAQVASDGGKRDNSLYGEICQQADSVWGAGYGIKDKFILRAIHLISLAYQQGDRTYRYYITTSTEYGLQALVYFEFLIGKERRQISFHSYSRKLIRKAKKAPKSFEVSWNGIWGGSRDACRELADCLNLQ